VLLNSAACFVIAGKSETFADGIKLAADMIDSGKALEKMHSFIKATHEVAE
jgi:anthranilate phosphoribosyltransferase